MSTGIFHDHFSVVANRYANFRPHYPAALFDYLATLVPRQARVWDCAAGNGQASHDLARRFSHVVATDASKEQIASATPEANIEFRVARADQSGLPDASIDLITVAQAVHWFDMNFFAEAERVLKPGGVLAVWAYGIKTVEGDAVNRLVQDFYANKVGPYWPPERKLVEDEYRTIRFPFAEIIPPAFRMEARWTLAQLLCYFSTWSATNRYIKANGENPTESLAVALAPVWGDPEKPKLVTWPLAVRVSRK